MSTNKHTSHQRGTRAQKIFLFTPLYPPHVGGSATFSSQLVSELGTRPRSTEFVVLTSYHPDSELVERGTNSRVFRLLPRFQSLPSCIRILLETVFGLAATALLLLLHDVDIAHIHPVSYATPMVAVLAKLAGIPLIYDCRGAGFPQWLIAYIPPDSVFSTSPVIDDIMSNCGIDKSDIYRTPIINPEYVGEYSNNRIVSQNLDNFRLLYVGKLRKEKGIELVLDSFEQLAPIYTELELHLIGDGPLRSKVESRATHSRFRDRIIYHERLSHRETLEQISSADLLLHPSARETGPRTVLEACEIGTPVVATSVGIVPELFTHTELGTIIERSVDSIVDSVEQFIKKWNGPEPYCTGEPGDFSRATWKEIADTVEEAYESTMAPQ